MPPNKKLSQPTADSDFSNNDVLYAFLMTGLTTVSQTTTNLFSLNTFSTRDVKSFDTLA